jgi:hypothetical protein
VDESAEAVASNQVTRGCDGALMPNSCRRYELQRAVWPVGVVVVDEDGENVLEVAAVEDEEPVGCKNSIVMLRRVRIRESGRRADRVGSP